MSIEDLSTQELEEKFENFLFNMDDYLEQLTSKASDQGIILDFSLGSLKELERYIIENNTKQTDDDYNDISAYLGEVLVQNYGAKWHCNLDNVNNSLYYGFPVLEGHSGKDVLFSPFHVVKAFILRQKENLFINAIKSQTDPEPIDWSKLPSE